MHNIDPLTLALVIYHLSAFATSSAHLRDKTKDSYRELLTGGAKYTTGRGEPLRIAKERSIFKPLTDARDFEAYSMALASDPSQRRHLIPRAIFEAKMRYV